MQLKIYMKHFQYKKKKSKSYDINTIDEVVVPPDARKSALNEFGDFIKLTWNNNKSMNSPEDLFPPKQ